MLSAWDYTILVGGVLVTLLVAWIVVATERRYPLGERSPWWLVGVVVLCVAATITTVATAWVGLFDQFPRWGRALLLLGGLGFAFLWRQRSKPRTRV